MHEQFAELVRLAMYGKGTNKLEFGDIVFYLDDYDDLKVANEQHLVPTNERLIMFLTKHARRGFNRANKVRDFFAQ